MKDYEEFIIEKSIAPVKADSILVDANDLNPMLYAFQRDIVRWALAKGRAAIFADCGMGKTPMQLEWSHRIAATMGGMVLILAPLAVTHQTVEEGRKFGIKVTLCESSDDLKPGINITNYDKLQKFDGCQFTGVVLDESSILKSFDGKVRNQIVDFFSNTPFRLACTATPAPNDYMELGNHSEFLGVMPYTEMLAMFFVHDGGQTSKWRLKGHAETVFWEWMGTWAVVMESPRDLGYTIEGYDLPELRVHEMVADEQTDSTTEPKGTQSGNGQGETINFLVEAGVYKDDDFKDAKEAEAMTLLERRQARRDSLQARCEMAAQLVNDSCEQWLVWCDLNSESDLLHKLMPDSVEVKGSDSVEDKADRMLGFTDNKYRVMVTKPSIAGFGMNWQNCHKMIFTGLSDSYEQYYQAVRRCWRFGQDHPVDVYIIISAKEGAVKENIERKEADSKKMRRAMTEQTKEITKKNLQSTQRLTTPYEPKVPMRLPEWGDIHACA